MDKDKFNLSDKEVHLIDDDGMSNGYVYPCGDVKEFIKKERIIILKHIIDEKWDELGEELNQLAGDKLI